jgi:hypothetical protein
MLSTFAVRILMTVSLGLQTHSLESFGRRFVTVSVLHPGLIDPCTCHAGPWERLPRYQQQCIPFYSGRIAAQITSLRHLCRSVVQQDR